MQQRTNPALDARILASLAEQKAYRLANPEQASAQFLKASKLWQDAFFETSRKSPNKQWCADRKDTCYRLYELRLLGNMDVVPYSTGESQ